VSIPVGTRGSGTGIDIKFAQATSSVFKFDVQEGCNLGAIACSDEKNTGAGVKQWEFKDNCLTSGVSPGLYPNDAPARCYAGGASFSSKLPPSVLYIRVYRDGADLSCDQYTLLFNRK
jgi:hypothetical protein